MSDGFPEHFLLVPDQSQENGKLYTLVKSETFIQPGFVLIPYANPQVQQITPHYFSVSGEQTISLVSFSRSAKKEKEIILKAGFTKAEYLKKVRLLKEEIQKGNIYEINFCLSFQTVGVVIDPVQVFLELAAISKAPYACLLKYSNRYILCSSPELFLKKEGKRISTKPIKGTIRRGTHPEEDALLRDKLFNDLKERTENVMAVDVARNDLSVFASRGSVKVNRLYNIESFETVHQMVSTVSCEMKTGTGFNDMVAASFPMASMTGAPKKRAMTLIDSHEGFKRGEYSGAMGLVSSNGDFELAVIIRSIFYDSSSNSLSIAAGSAITYLSEPEDEYRECLLKAKALLTALNAKIDG